jgi:hypothetical protein
LSSPAGSPSRATLPLSCAALNSRASVIATMSVLYPLPYPKSRTEQVVDCISRAIFGPCTKLKGTCIDTSAPNNSFPGSLPSR